jgi:nucleotide-binding universal stress UspA family protein
MTAMSVLLVPVDLSEASLGVCEHAAAIAARLSRLAVIILYVMETEEEYADLMAPEPRADRAAAHPAAAFDRLREPFTRRAINVDTAFCVGEVVSTILAESQKRRAELVVVGSHGRGALHSLLVGSTTAGLIRRSTIPIVVIPPQAQPAT